MEDSTNRQSPIAFTGEAIVQAAEYLRRGQLVSFPTETVYGLGCDATNSDALRKLYQAKGRPFDHPVIVHLHSIEQLSQWTDDVPAAAFDLAEAFWPGPLTMILNRSPKVLDQVTGGQSTVALRMPNHPVAIELLRAFNEGVAAPSANKFGRLSPTNAWDVASAFGPEIAMVLDGGDCHVGIESTIIDLSAATPRVLRPGMIDVQELSAVLGVALPAEVLGNDADHVRVPGSLPSHYAPLTPLYLVRSERLPDLVLELTQSKEPFAVLAFQGNEKIDWILAAADPDVYARELYRNLRRLDAMGLSRIIVEEPPAEARWMGIRDRLNRAGKKVNSQ